MKHILIIFAFVVFLTGCISPQERRQQHADKCISYGLKPNTNQFAQCMFHQGREADKAFECIRAGLRGFSNANPTSRLGSQMGEASRSMDECR